MTRTLKTRTKQGNVAKEKQYYYRLLEVYARFLAPMYDAFFLYLSIGTEPRLREKVAEVATVGTKFRILDLATGTGKQAFAFAKRRSEVIGLDFSRDMIEKAQRKKRDENLEFIISDAAQLPFEEGIFDVSCVSFALHDMIPSVRERAIEELARVTKNEGTIIIVDYAVPKTVATRLFAKLFTLFEPYYTEFMKYDLESLLTESGVQITMRIPILFGEGRILKARKLPNRTFFRLNSQIVSGHKAASQFRVPIYSATQLKDKEGGES